MNLSGVFSYGNLLKTFLPGLLLVLGLTLLADGYNFYTTNPHTYLILKTLTEYPIISIAIIGSASIFMGIISNSIHFKWVIPLIGASFEKNNESFVNFKEAMQLEMNEHYSTLLQIDQNHKPIGKNGFDVRAFLLNRTDLSALQYLRESYWYYMEFQLNSIGALFVLLIAGLLHMILRLNLGLTPEFYFWPIVMSMMTFTLITTIVFSKAAYENYEKHEKKFFSFCLGTYHICRYGKVKTPS